MADAVPGRPKRGVGVLVGRNEQQPPNGCLQVPDKRDPLLAKWNPRGISLLLNMSKGPCL